MRLSRFPFLQWLLFSVLAIGAGFLTGRIHGPAPVVHAAATLPGSPAAPGHFSAAASALLRRVHADVTAPVAAAVPLPAANAPLPEGPFAGNIDALTALADHGSAAAARALYDGYLQCRWADPDADDASAEREATRATVAAATDRDRPGSADGAASVRARVPAPVDADVMRIFDAKLAAARERIAACRGAERRDWPDFLHWLERAAELGDAQAQIDYVKIGSTLILPLTQSAAMAHIKRRSAEFAAAALARGDARILPALIPLAEMGVYTEPDAVAAYAFAYAAMQSPVAAAGLRPWQFRVRSGGAEDLAAVEVARLAARLSPAERARAEAAGAEIYRVCCTGAPR